MEAEKTGQTFLGSRGHLVLYLSLRLRQKSRSPAVSYKSSNIPNQPREPPGTTETRPVTKPD